MANQPQKCPGITGFLPLPVNNFKYFLTLFSKFFSSFPHGTCSLSVSHRYLALDGIYHPLRAAIPNNSTRRKLVGHHDQRRNTGLSPSTATLSRVFHVFSQLHWPGPRSLVTTSGVSVDVLSFGYLDISVPRVRLFTPILFRGRYPL